MVCHSPFDDDIMHSDSVTYQVSESPERETPGQWLPPSPILYTNDWRPTEPSNKRPDRLQLITKHWLPNGRHVDLPDHHITLANLTGRSYAEAFQDPDFDSLHRPRESSPHTPSLASDDSHSRDSPSCTTPRNLNKDLSVSPRLVSQASFGNNEYSETELSLPVASMEIDPTTKSNNTTASAIQSPASPTVFQIDVLKDVESPVTYCAPEASTPPSEASPRIQCSFQISESSSSHHAVPKPSASTTMPPPMVVAKMAESYTEQDDLMDDAYLPEPPTNGSGTKGRTKKHSKSLNFECPYPQCLQRFTRNFDRQRHIKTIHAPKTMETIIAHTCICCGARLSRKDAFKRHIEKIPNSCNTVAKRSQKPEPARLSEEMYAIHKIQMMEVLCGRQSA